MRKRFLATLLLLAAMAVPSFGQTLQSIQTVPSYYCRFPRRAICSAGVGELQRR